MVIYLKTKKNFESNDSILDQILEEQRAILSEVREELLMLESHYKDLIEEIEQEDRNLTFVGQKIEVSDIEDPSLDEYLDREKKIKKNLKELNDKKFNIYSEIKGHHYDLNDLESIVHQLMELNSAKKNNQYISSKNNLESLSFFSPLIKNNAIAIWDEDKLIYNITLKYPENI